MIVLDTLVDLLPHVSKPIQYVGGEINAVRKPWAEMAVKIGLCFPDAYEVGMSHLGLQILYALLNAEPDVVAERLYAPFEDMERLMRTRDIPLYSVDSYHAAAEFDILGFTLQYELSYSNVLNMLDLAGIPVLSSERTEQHPLIIAGGPCSCNPEPLADMCDLFVIGDGEVVLPQFLQYYRAWQQAPQASKQELLKSVCDLPGIYVPSFYTVMYEADGRIAGITPAMSEAPETIQRAVAPDLDVLPYLDAPVVPYLKTVHDRLTLEIMRGCARGCRFCQAGFIYRPLRERSAEHLTHLAQTLLAQSGYDEISLSSLSTGDYSQISELLAILMGMCETSKVSLSLPSMRVNTLTEKMAATIRRVRKTGFTLAPEAGTQRLRNVINKGISEAEILHTAEDAFTAGWDILKLYFMVGLPTETEEDIDGIVELVQKIRKLGNRIAKRKVKLNIGVSSFVPKAHTPFEWEALSPIETSRQKQLDLQRRFRTRLIQFKWHDVKTSYLEAVFARGDRRLGKVLLEAHRLGCKFDGWHEYFDFTAWTQAFQRTGIDSDEYVYRERTRDEVFPWDHIQTGVDKDYLWNERLKGLQEKCSPPCDAECRRCQVCGQERGLTVSKSAVPQQQASLRENGDSRPTIRAKAYRLRAVFCKTGMLRFLSHLEVGRVFQRAAARIQAPIAYSQGFHPHPQIAFGPALPVGAAGKREYVDFFFSEVVETVPFLQRMNVALPEGIDLSEAFPVDLKAASLSAIVDTFFYDVHIPDVLIHQGYTSSVLTRRCEEFQRQEAYQVTGFKKRSEPVDIKPFISSLEVTADSTGGPHLQMILQTVSQVIMKPEDVLTLIFHIPNEYILDCQIVRIAVGSRKEPAGVLASDRLL